MIPMIEGNLLNVLVVLSVILGCSFFVINLEKRHNKRLKDGHMTNDRFWS